MHKYVPFVADLILFILFINQIVYTHSLRLHIISCQSYHIISFNIRSYHIILYHIVSRNVTPCFLITTISILPPCAFDLCHNFHVPGWSDRKRLGRLGQLHSISFARIREWTRRAGARGFLDRAGFTADGSVEDFKRRRATEIKHGRISMLATMGYITPATWIFWSCV